MLKSKPIKPCRDCKEEFKRFDTLQTRCTPCLIKHGRGMQKKANRKELRVYKEKNKTRSDHLKAAQKSFNAFIRERDKSLPCISCGVMRLQSDSLTGGGFDCGHYRSVGSAPELRFVEINAHKQCKKCNNHLSGNIVEYRNGLIKRIGAGEIKWLEGYHKPQNWTHADLKDINQYYKEKLKSIAP